jgi:hypothetical protein
MNWMLQFMQILQAEPREVTAVAMARRIHEALEAAEVSKYATAESRFSFVLEGASEGDLDAIRRHLTEQENAIVEIQRANMMACVFCGGDMQVDPLKFADLQRHPHHCSEHNAAICPWCGMCQSEEATEVVQAHAHETRASMERLSKWWEDQHQKLRRDV